MGNGISSGSSASELSNKRLLIAAPASGHGKTTVTVALLAALLAKTVRPAACKCGPDYIDPLFHRTVLGLGGYNLDLFFCPPPIIKGLLHSCARRSDITIIEGVMGFYDGAASTTDASSWQLAAETRTPTVLVLQPGSAWLSLAAIVKGFCEFRSPSMIRGLILNNCREAHYSTLSAMLHSETGIPVYGFLPPMPEAIIGSRHLGLVTPDAVDSIRNKVEHLGRQAAMTLDIDGLLELAADAPLLSMPLPAVETITSEPVPVAVARDDAFCFYYQENLDLLEKCGARLQFFSPLHDPCLPTDSSALYIGGGYPELFSESLTANRSMLESIASACRAGMPVLAECGGFLYLQKTLEDQNGNPHPMAGFINGKGFRSEARSRFGYITVTAERDTLLLPEGESVQAHEFHYWDTTTPGDACCARKPDGRREWRCVHGDPSLFAGFPHIYFWSNPATAARLVKSADAWRSRGK